MVLRDLMEPKGLQVPIQQLLVLRVLMVLKDQMVLKVPLVLIQQWLVLRVLMVLKDQMVLKVLMHQLLLLKVLMELKVLMDLRVLMVPKVLTVTQAHRVMMVLKVQMVQMAHQQLYKQQLLEIFLQLPVMNCIFPQVLQLMMKLFFMTLVVEDLIIFLLATILKFKTQRYKLPMVDLL
tara:strand:- start:20 stop:553 length:534 start_codon:yes stop_codon:yes gene_type:complete